MSYGRERRWKGWVVVAALPGVAGCTVQWATDTASFGFTIGLLTLVVANLLYLFWRWEDNPGELRRAVAFFAGLPFTFLTFLLVEPNDTASLRRALLEETKDDPLQVEADFQRELMRVRRFRRPAAADPALEGSLDEPRTSTYE